MFNHIVQLVVGSLTLYSGLLDYREQSNYMYICQYTYTYMSVYGKALKQVFPKALIVFTNKPCFDVIASMLGLILTLVIDVNLSCP